MTFLIMFLKLKIGIKGIVKFICQSVILILFLIPIPNCEIIAQTIDEFEEYVNVEIRDTHILYVQLIQSEINGQTKLSGKVSYIEDNGRIYVVAQSLIKTNKDFESIRLDIGRAMTRLRQSDLIRLDRSNYWEITPDESQIRSSWTATDVRSNSKMELMIYYTMIDKEVLISTASHQSLSAN